MRILLVEDSPVNIKLALILLKKLSHHVIVAKNGEKGVELFMENHKKKPVQCVLMDIHMPIMDGLEATRKIREYEKIHGTRTPIIAMTATFGTEDNLELSKNGMDMVLQKPITLESLTEAFQKIIT